MIQLVSWLNPVRLIFAGFLRALVEKPVFLFFVVFFFLPHLVIVKVSNWQNSILLRFIWKWYNLEIGNAILRRKKKIRETGLWLLYLPPGLVWRQYVLLIISIGIYYLRKEVYLIPLSKCVYREAQQYISMLRKQTIRTSMLYFMHVNKGRLLYLICFCKLSGL